METLIVALVIAAVIVVILLAMATRIVWRYEQGVVFRLGRLRGPWAPGFRLMILFIDMMRTREDNAARGGNAPAAPAVRQANGIAKRGLR
jgi:regulator of protease activity HflC (stomatin/prohibitin superfamily)